MLLSIRFLLRSTMSSLLQEFWDRPDPYHDTLFVVRSILVNVSVTILLFLSNNLTSLHYHILLVNSLRKGQRGISSKLFSSDFMQTSVASFSSCLHSISTWHPSPYHVYLSISLQISAADTSVFTMMGLPPLLPRSATGSFLRLRLAEVALSSLDIL